MTEEQTAALAAASQAAEASAALIRFACAGEYLIGWAFDLEVAAYLADALSTTLRIELPRMASRDMEANQPTRETAEQLLATLGKFLEVWA